MPFGRLARMVLVLVLLALALVWLWHTSVQPERATLFVTAVIGAVTTIYALFTYEILLQNQQMAKAAVESSKLMEQSLRFSHAPNLMYHTLNTKDPIFAGSIVPVENEDYKRAVAEFTAGGQQKEFVFAIVENKGQGAATNLKVESVYKIVDSSNPNRDATIAKEASVPILDPGNGVALCVFISKVPTADDRVTLVSARVTASDFYRDAIKEDPQDLTVDPQRHQVESEQGCVVRLT